MKHVETAAEDYAECHIIRYNVYLIKWSNMYLHL